MSQFVDYADFSSKARSERNSRFRVNRLYLVLGLVLAGVGASAVWREASRLDNPTPANLFWHFAASPNCDAARAVGLDQARRGEPGYWLSHDRDRDGIACESSNENPVFLQR